MGIENSLKAYGLDPKVWEEKLDAMVQNAMDDACTGTNPRKPTFEEMKMIFESCFSGGIANF